MRVCKAQLNQMIILDESRSWDSEHIAKQSVRAIVSDRCAHQHLATEHAQEVVRQIVEQEQHFLSAPITLAPVCEEQPLLVLSDINFESASQVILLTECQERQLQVCGHI